LALESKKVVLLLDGPPARKAYWGIHPDEAREVTFQNENFCICDYDIFEGHEYWLNAGRFFSGTGYGQESFPLSHGNGHSDESDSIAVRASRSARFENYKK